MTDTPDQNRADPIEDARLEALARYSLTSEPEQDFDDIVAMAAEICDVPVALVNIVEAERQFFKARIGIDISETPRDVSICQFAIREDVPFIIPDARRDPRFADNPFVTAEPGIRFYAGFPLVTRDGHALGTLCVIDHEPRTLDAQQIRMLRILARQAMSQIELGAALEKSRAAHAEAERLRAGQHEIAMEMTHRVKNTLAIVQSIVAQTLRRSPDVEQARKAIDARLLTLARAQDVLTRSALDDIDVRALISAALGPHMQGENDPRFVLSGPPLLLGARQALGLALGLHELATNATKYGALSQTGGTIALTWNGADAACTLEWAERGGPRVEVPTERGFGSTLIERIVAGYFEGEARLTFDPEGVHFTLSGRARRPEARS
ncbi:MAG: HWE histidine kinase domain-containing protein [Pseudomonadota bacterium]|uniref:sensor histidine kinase n=1 Tax=Novosphingobium sp. MBES04 TaxID=1206458 RepID=UPI0006945B82|nr:HWE histidine kinase domain-containing protein [Novosphingobium sp. MBES04]MED5544419.1 HWE histidine kinase domain-containing protein [Pseudomonadota bacterium]GAM03370.1 signal transduction histidine kinase [Novosphingobium sp. MBES04]